MRPTSHLPGRCAGVARPCPGARRDVMHADKSCRPRHLQGFPMRARELLSSTIISLISLAAAAATTASAAETQAAPAGEARFIVQAANLQSARQDIRRVGAEGQQNLGIINAASAYL